MEARRRRRRTSGRPLLWRQRQRMALLPSRYCVCFSRARARLDSRMHLCENAAHVFAAAKIPLLPRQTPGQQLDKRNETSVAVCCMHLIYFVAKIPWLAWGAAGPEADPQLVQDPQPHSAAPAPLPGPFRSGAIMGVVCHAARGLTALAGPGKPECSVQAPSATVRDGLTH